MPLKPRLKLGAILCKLLQLRQRESLARRGQKNDVCPPGLSFFKQASKTSR